MRLNKTLPLSLLILLLGSRTVNAEGFGFGGNWPPTSTTGLFLIICELLLAMVIAYAMNLLLFRVWKKSNVCGAVGLWLASFLGFFFVFVGLTQTTIGFDGPGFAALAWPAAYLLSCVVSFRIIFKRPSIGQTNPRFDPWAVAMVAHFFALLLLFGITLILFSVFKRRK